MRVAWFGCMEEGVTTGVYDTQEEQCFCKPKRVNLSNVIICHMKAGCGTLRTNLLGRSQLDVD